METVLKHRKMKIVVQAVVFGLIFGFLLQKGGVTKYHVLIGQLLLEDFTVMKVMLSAILVAMAGLYILRRNNKIKPHIKPARIASNIVGGLIFGVGFAFAGYCPGTGAAALGQGDAVALLPMLGLVVGSYLFAEWSGVLKHTIGSWGDKGKVALHTSLRINTGPSVVIFGILIFGVLVFIGQAEL